jgi:hypothetical protein
MSKTRWFQVAPRVSKQARPKYAVGAIVDRIKRAARAERLAPARRLGNHRRWFEHPARRNG